MDKEGRTRWSDIKERDGRWYVLGYPDPDIELDPECTPRITCCSKLYTQSVERGFTLTCRYILCSCCALHVHEYVSLTWYDFNYISSETLIQYLSGYIQKRSFFCRSGTLRSAVSANSLRFQRPESNQDLQSGRHRSSPRYRSRSSIVLLRFHRTESNRDLQSGTKLDSHSRC